MEITVPIDLPSLNVTLRTDRFERKKVLTKIKLWLIQNPINRIPPLSKIIITRYGRELDEDNLQASAKPFLDALTTSGFLLDDKGIKIEVKNGGKGRGFSFSVV
jgi:hypothetical protein